MRIRLPRFIRAQIEKWKFRDRTSVQIRRLFDIDARLRRLERMLHLSPDILKLNNDLVEKLKEIEEIHSASKEVINLTLDSITAQEMQRKSSNV